MTVEEVAVAALSRAMEHSDRVPTTRSVMYLRIGRRLQELYAVAAQVSDDYYGVCAIGTVVDNQVDLASMSDPVESPETISRVEVKDPGTSDYSAGQMVHVVRLGDEEVAFPPRVTLRNRKIRGVGADLDGVAKLEVYYSRVPLAVGPKDGSRDLDFPQQFQELLVIDLARDLFRRSTTLPNRQALVAMMDQEETPLLDAFRKHVAAFSPLETRYA